MLYKIGTIIGIGIVVLILKGLEIRANKKYKERIQREEEQRNKRYKINKG